MFLYSYIYKETLAEDSSQSFKTDHTNTNDFGDSSIIKSTIDLEKSYVSTGSGSPNLNHGNDRLLVARNKLSGKKALTKEMLGGDIHIGAANDLRKSTLEEVI